MNVCTNYRHAKACTCNVCLLNFCDVLTMVSTHSTDRLGYITNDLDHIPEQQGIYWYMYVSPEYSIFGNDQAMPRGGSAGSLGIGMCQ